MKRNNLVLFLILFCLTPAKGQITISSLAEIQRGKVPGADSTAISNIYEQFALDFSQRGLQAGIRAEVYNVWGADRQITEITQKYARWSNGSFYVVAGNYYAMLGRGLTLRAFELPGVITESHEYRVRYTPSQDLEGGLVSWTGDRIEAKALIGRPAESTIPPGATFGNPPRNVSRRTDWISGGELAVRPVHPLKFGGTFVYVDPQNPASDPHQVWSGLLDVDFTSLLDRGGETGLYGSFYAEYAQRVSASDGHGLYLAGNIGGSRLGLSVEYKDYDNFTLKFNEPPSLVREHTVFLLNRSTHVLLTLNERGYQVEGTYAHPDFATFTANMSLGRNNLAPGNVKNFKERFISIDFESFLPTFSVTTFFDWGQNQLKGIERSRVGGVILETSTGSGQTLGLDMQLQSAGRSFGEPADFWETYISGSWQHPLGFGVAVVMDRTTDPFEVDRPETFDIETEARIFWSLNLNARIGRNHSATLFAGERRGGTSCTSGTCYPVLPFEGVEMRINTYF